MAAPDGAIGRRGDPLAFVDRFGFQRWAAILFAVDVIGLAAVFLRLNTNVSAPLSVLFIAVIPPLWAALVWSLRTRLGLPDPSRRWITALGLAGAAVELVNALIAAAGGGLSGPLNVLVLACQGGWLVAFGLSARRARTFSDQSPTLAVIAGVGLLLAGLGRILASGSANDPLEVFASVLVLAEYVWLFRLARTRPAPALDPA